MVIPKFKNVLEKKEMIKESIINYGKLSNYILIDNCNPTMWIMNQTTKKLILKEDGKLVLMDCDGKNILIDLPIRRIKKLKKVSVSEFKVFLKGGEEHTFELVETFPEDWIFAI